VSSLIMATVSTPDKPEAKKDAVSSMRRTLSVVALLAIAACNGQIVAVQDETKPHQPDGSVTGKEAGASVGVGTSSDAGLACVHSGNDWTCSGYAQPMPSCPTAFNPFASCVGSTSCLVCDPRTSLSGHIFTCSSGQWMGTPGQNIWSCPQ
jgi:hypothetical protein